MSPTVELSPDTIERLKKFAEPLVDTFDTVVAKALAALEAANGRQATIPADEIKFLNPAAPPNLSHTTVHSIDFDGRRFPPAETYWNLLLHAVIRRARQDLSAEAVADLIICNKVVGKKENNGYKYLEDAGISIQGADANGAWKATYYLLDKLNLPTEIVFSWQDNPKAAMPNQRARFSVQ
jgi:hypothetical protein